jgi:endonuclease/exonuclease/phosphatase family metal-dependent hydrolase
MKHKLNALKMPEIEIDNPKNKKGLDLSDHYPIIIEGADLKVISYNIQLMHSIVGVKGKKTRAEKQRAVTDVANYFLAKEADVCCVQELFDNEANKLMELAMLEKGYVAEERVGSKWLSVLNGGVRTFVKRDLARGFSNNEHIYTHKIDTLVGADALVNKGVLHTTLNKKGKIYHVFNTHLQAYYPDRDHYAEITLAQCVEIKKFIEDEKSKGLIGPDDQIILCGDFNIPKPSRGEDNNLLYTKLTRLMGPYFTFLNYKENPNGPKHTRALENSYNVNEGESSDNNVNLDLAATFNPTNKGISSAEVELSKIFCTIQLVIAHFVTNNTSITNKWLLSKDSNAQLDQFNIQLEELIEQAVILEAQNVSPLNDPKWLALALQLQRGPAYANQSVGKDKLATSLPKKEEQSIPADNLTNQIPNDEEKDLIEQVDSLLEQLNKLHEEIRDSHAESPSNYEKILASSLKINHKLINARNAVKEGLTTESFIKFKTTCKDQFSKAQEVFKSYKHFEKPLNSLFKELSQLINNLEERVKQNAEKHKSP